MSDSFEALMAEVMAGAHRFGHREHVHLTWLAVRRYGTRAAVDVVSDGIQRTARYAGAPQKYHATVSRAWVELVGHHAFDDANDPRANDPSANHPSANHPRANHPSANDFGAADFDGFVARFPALLDKRLLAGHYRSTTLASIEAKTGWVEPDLAPLPAAPR